MTGVTHKALHDAARLGIGRDDAERHLWIGRMMRYCTRITHPAGGWRFGGFVMETDENGTVLRIARVRRDQQVCPACLDSGKTFDGEEAREAPCSSCAHSLTNANAEA